MTDKQNFENKATFTYGKELLTGKQTKYEFVKQNFEKDIDVPSKQIIDGVDVRGCSAFMEDYQRANNIEGRYEHIKNVCELGERGVEEFWFECKNNPNCHYKQLKRKEQECEKAKKIIETAVDDFNLEYGTPQYDRLLNGAKSLGIEVKDNE